MLNELKVTVQVKGGAWVQGPLGIRVKAEIECDIHCSVEKMFDVNPHEVVEGKSCKYRYF